MQRSRTVAGREETASEGVRRDTDQYVCALME